MATTQVPHTHRFTTHNPTDQEIIVLGNMHRQGHMSLIIWASTDAEDWYRHCDPPARCSNKPYQICDDHTWSQGKEANWFAACRKASGWLAAATRSMRKTSFCNPVTKSTPGCKEQQSQWSNRRWSQMNEWKKTPNKIAYLNRCKTSKNA